MEVYKMKQPKLLTPSLTALVLVLALMLGLVGAVGAQDAPDSPTARGWMGVNIVAQEAGVTIREFMPDSPAADAGLLVGDVIVALDDQAVIDIEDLIMRVSSYAPGETVSLEVLRDGESLTFDVVLGERPAEMTFEARPDQPQRPQRLERVERPSLGIQYQPLEDGNFAANLGLAVNEGALVLNVTPESAAALAGLEGGDIISAIDETPINAQNQLATVISGYAVGDTISLSVLRAGETLTLEATLQAGRAMGMLEGVQVFPIDPRNPSRDGLPFNFERGQRFDFENLPPEILPFLNFDFENLPPEAFQFFNLEGLEGLDLNSLAEMLPQGFEGEPFSLVCRDANGETVFSLSFSANGLSSNFNAPRGQRLSLNELACEIVQPE